MISRQPTAVCKRCGRNAPADSFVLDHLLGMLVCADCVKEQKSKVSKAAVMKATSDVMNAKSKTALTAAQPVQKPVQEEVKERPAGWDSEDEYLERAHKQRQKLNVNFERLDDSRVRYTCTKCQFRFIYHISKKYPSMCPNCGASVVTSLIR